MKAKSGVGFPPSHACHTSVCAFTLPLFGTVLLFRTSSLLRRFSYVSRTFARRSPVSSSRQKTFSEYGHSGLCLHMTRCAVCGFLGLRNSLPMFVHSSLSCGVLFAVALVCHCGVTVSSLCVRAACVFLLAHFSVVAGVSKGVHGHCLLLITHLCTFSDRTTGSFRHKSGVWNSLDLQQLRPSNVTAPLS
jgi:hypothetical protein